MGCTFKGYNLDDYGVIFEKMPAIKKPKRRVDTVYIDNRNGYESSDRGLDGYSSDCTVILTEPEHFDFLKSLFDGAGQLIRNHIPTRYQNTKIQDEISFKELGTALKATFDFDIEDPFFYLVGESNVVLSSASSVVNGGTFESEPLIKLTGTGYVTVSINGRSFTYNFDTPFVFIDTKSKEVYYDDLTLKNRQFGGVLPILDVGSNVISWTGIVTEMVITKRTRWL